MVLISPFSSTQFNEYQAGVGIPNYFRYQIVLDRVMHVLLHFIVFKFGIKNFTTYYMIHKSVLKEKATLS